MARISNCCNASTFEDNGRHYCDKCRLGCRQTYPDNTGPVPKPGPPSGYPPGYPYDGCPPCTMECL